MPHPSPSKIAALALLLVAGTAQTQTAPTLIRGARVFDGTTMLGVRDVLIRDGLIATVARSITPAAGAAVIDARGKTLLPGLIDAHTHTFGDVLRQALAFGVTTQLEMFTGLTFLHNWREEQRTGR